MLTSGQYKKVIKLEKQGCSIRGISAILGYSRNTVRKVLDVRKPMPFKTPFRPSVLDGYKNCIDENFRKGGMDALQVYHRITEDGFEGPYSTVRRYLSQLAEEDKNVLRKSSRTKQQRVQKQVMWVLGLLQGKIGPNEIEKQFSDHLDSESVNKLYNHILKGPLRNRNRSMTVLAYLDGIPQRTVAEMLSIQRNTVRSYIEQFESRGIQKLFDFSRKETKKCEEPKYIEEVFKILHAPPSVYGFNRTTWRMEDLYRTLAKEGFSLSKPYIRQIIKTAGYRFLKAKKVLTSTDPQYHEKLKEITNTLSNLKNNEKFFSIDEFGPFAIKMQGGRSWVPQGGNRIVPQWQKSKGSLILTAALELSTNQVTHFYSAKKNTDEMIKLLEILLKKYKEERIFFSWDAASWHASKKLYKKIGEVNGESYRSMHKTPFVALAPLPASAQFLNVIESIFSGMAKAIIHNSDYASVEECKAAIDRYFAERNQYFFENPKRAGNKIWGKEITKVEFNESNNCKDPRYG